MNKKKVHKKNGGIKRYIFHKSTIVITFIMALLLTMKNSEISIEPSRSLLYDVFVVKKENWQYIDLFGTAVYQMDSVVNISSWLIMFLPFLVAYPFVTILCDDFHSNFICSAVVREGFNRYMRGVYRYGIMSIFVIGAIALLFFSLFCIVTCYPVSDIELESQLDLYRVILQRANDGMDAPDITLYIFPILVQYFKMIFTFLIAGMVSFLFAAITKNKYFSLCIPCLLYYFLIKLSEGLANAGYMWGDYISPMSLFHYSFNWVVLIIMTISIIALSEELFVLIIGREVDRVAC